MLVTASRFMFVGCGLCPHASRGSGAKPGAPTPGGPLSLVDSCPRRHPAAEGAALGTPCRPPEGGRGTGPPDACALACAFALPARTS